MKMIKTISLTLAMNAAMVMAAPTIKGELKKWHKVTLEFAGPSTNETATPNPFSDYRLEVEFTKGSKTYTVPGYFAADGDADNTGAAAGNKWHVNFAPDEVGVWNYKVSFKTGTDVAIELNDTKGTAVAGIHGETGTFTVAASDKSGKDLRARGKLRYVGEHYLQFAETGEFFIKA